MAVAQQGLDKARMNRVAFASLAGTTIEWYDFYVYGTAAALVFPHLFFPGLGSAAALVASFATFGVPSSPGRWVRSSSATTATGSAASARWCSACCSWAVGPW